MIEFGISRIKFANAVVDALFKELKQASISGKCQILVAIGAFNSLFTDHTNIKDDNKKIVPAHKVSLTRSFLEITKSDWCNGQIVLTVDKVATKVSSSYFINFTFFAPTLKYNSIADNKYKSM